MQKHFFFVLYLSFDRVKQYHTRVLFSHQISANVTDFIQDFNKQVNIVSYILDSVLSVYIYFISKVIYKDQEIMTN